MSVFPRPADPITKAHLFIGQPIVEFSPALSTGGFGPHRSLGIIDAAAIQKTIELATLRNPQSGVSRLEREIVRLFEGRLALSVFNFDPENMRLFLAARDLTAVSGGTVAVVNELLTLTDDDRDFVNLDNMLVTEPLTGLDVAQIVLEAVGIGQGTPFGETLGQFSLDFPIKVIGDVTSYLENTTERVADLVGGNPPVPSPARSGSTRARTRTAGRSSTSRARRPRLVSSSPSPTSPASRRRPATSWRTPTTSSTRSPGGCA